VKWTFEGLWQDYQAILRYQRKAECNRWRHYRRGAFLSHTWEPSPESHRFKCGVCGMTDLEFHVMPILAAWCTKQVDDEWAQKVRAEIEEKK
jgi:hypothetical protein